MALRDELLNPIAGENPGGVELRYDPLFDKIKEARREDVDAPQGEWVVELKKADWPLTIKLSKEALATKSKDLQIAAWLTEALLHREGFAGLQAGLDVLAGLLETHWDHLYPEIEDGDLEMRVGPLEWIGGNKFDIPVRMVAVDRNGHSFIDLRDARMVPSETAANDSEERAAVRAAAIANGRITPEDIEAGFTATPKPWFKALVADIEGSLVALAKLDEMSMERFGDLAPSFAALKESLEEVRRSAASQLKHKLEIDPDPVDATATDDDGVALPPGVVLPGSVAGAARGPLTPEPTSRDDAMARIVGAARYLRANDPHNPAAYLLLRGARWGELRAGAGKLDPRLLEAPPTPVRTNLKSMLLDARWPELLETAEGVMGTPQGRGWLDLQRYVITAVDALGSDYFPVSVAMRGALKALLTDLPQLVEMTLMDDTPTANAETRNWLRTEKLFESAVETHSTEAPSGEAEENGEPRARDPVSLATAEVRAGRADRAIALLMKEAGRAKTSRERFMLQAELARIMVENGHEAVATPLLEQLIGAIESHKLEEWEAGEMVAIPMSLMYRVLGTTEADPSTRQSLYLRICKLDPIQAIRFTQS